MDRAGDLKHRAMIGGTPRWGKAAVFAAATEAELARQQLETAGIAVALLNDQTGIFGPGFAGPSALGVTVMVPEGDVAEARELIADLVEAFGHSIPRDP